MLKDIRKSKGYTMKRLAKESDTPLRTIQHWETVGVERATVGNALRVAKVLGCSVEDLL